MRATFDVNSIRREFPALARQVAGQPAVFFDGPAGSQVPRRVIAAIADYLAHHNANHGGLFATSVESDAMLDAVHQAAATFLGADDPACTVFGANMTSLTFALSRALARTWTPGDEVLVTRLDHDANVTPWVLAARDAGATVRHVEINRDDCTLDLENLRRKLSPRTKLVAVGAASNAVGTINPVAEICRLACEVGALSYVDAVHLAPHALPDVAAWGCDFAVCSAYKFFGPHLGLLWGRRELLERLPAYKVRPAPKSLPGRWMTGTQSHEAIAGLGATIDYLTELGDAVSSPTSEAPRARRSTRNRLRAAYEAIVSYERPLTARLIAGLREIDDVRVLGITDPARFTERVSTVSITHRRHAPHVVAQRLAERGIFVWHGCFYALEVSTALGLEPQGMVRIGLLHYNTAGEVDRLLQALAEL
ncbi:MAG: cysteine desulfurase-like protein [Pirellulales bacterium]|nr:cysteine desulfurase-like protein [Pirellulales bacterium]